MSDYLPVICHYTEMWLKKLEQKKRTIADKLDKEQFMLIKKEETGKVKAVETVVETLKNLIGTAILKEVRQQDVPKFKEVIIDIVKETMKGEPGADILFAANNVAKAMSEALKNIR